MENPKAIMICRLREFMDNQGVNIAQLARTLGVTETAIRGYAKNSFSRIDNGVAIKLCTHFKCGMGEMFEIRYE